MFPLLLTPKLYIPRPRPSLVSRRRLLERLDESFQTERKLILISAPAGFGKTTLLSEWLHRKDESKGLKNEPYPSSLIPHPFEAAWLSLDENDNDPLRFWAYLIAAVETHHPDIGQEAVALLHSSPPVPIESILTLLINALTTLAEPFILVLDDYHLIEAGVIHSGVSFLLDHLPVQMRLVIASRADPPLSLARLRAGHQLTELRAADLRFTSEEAAAFLNRSMGLDLTATDVSNLEARTEGWIAGLQLAALSMQGRCDVSSFIQAFAGSQRFVLDYLVEEVLSRQPDHIRSFLLGTSVLERVCGPLADAILIKDEGGDERKPYSESSSFILDYLDRANLFLIPLDDEGCWYRYHHLFAQALRACAQQTFDRAVITTLHHRAGDWFEQNGLPTEAMFHALAASDFERATHLIEQNAAAMLNRGEMSTLRGWLQAWPDAEVQSRPMVSVVYAWALLLSGQIDAVEGYLHHAETALTSAPENWPNLSGHIDAIRANLASFRGDFQQVIRFSLQAMERLSPHDLLIRSTIDINLGYIYMIMGDAEAARQTLERARSESETTGNVYVNILAWGSLAILEIGQGRLHKAAQMCRQVIQSIERDSVRRPLPGAGFVYIPLGEVLREWNDLEAAEHFLNRGLEIGSLGGDFFTLSLGYLALALVKQAQGQAAEVWVYLGKAEQMGSTQIGHNFLSITAHKVRLWLAQGYWSKARQWATSCGLSCTDDVSPARELEYLALARVWLAQGGERLLEASTLLTHMLSRAEAGGRTGRVVEILMLRALVWQAEGHTSQAMETLEQALRLAEPEGYVRLFVDEGPALTTLLQQMNAAGQGGSLQIKDYLGKLLMACPLPNLEDSSLARSHSVYPLVEPLSEREMEVLQLVAAGASNQQIAERLVISVGTVKTHLNHLMSKLDVRNRTEAVARARQLELL